MAADLKNGKGLSPYGLHGRITALLRIEEWQCAARGAVNSLAFLFAIWRQRKAGAICHKSALELPAAADVVGLADLDTVVPQDVVCGGDVEKHVGDGPGLH